MNLGAILLAGLLAGGVSCAAVQGGLLAGLVARQKGRTTGIEGGKRQPAMKQTWQAQLGGDLAPVGGFLAGKITSHALFGALLGAVGSAVQLSPNLRSTVQIVAGLLIIAFGLAQLGVPGFRSFAITLPASWVKLVRGRAHSTSALAPAILGFASILLPCGVTLSMMALAITSGSPVRGALTMAVFVLGTAPLFTLIGYVAHKAAAAWKGRLALATGIVVLLAGFYTLNGGLTLAGSPLAAQNLKQTFGIDQPAIADASTVTMADGTQTAVITVTSGRFSPANLALKAGVPTKVIFRSQGAYGCVRALVVPALNTQTVLPENGDTPFDLGITKAGRIDYSCSMGMYSGTITIS
ncbi:sulfite exporter TauE/SafE family protein [Nocardioides sp. NPDC057767]|jgi:sulfite exporter TauE/SafE|uniref:Sulfite exporter TauE/SafE n=1 Tax=Nocardioides albertanoniae TaxID=1175486 RepID=A0A543A3R4_9ACTN|nr:MULTISPECIES: sulfite exporter TauE/SafE family protein [Nocardioides]TQL67228.1 sulfite exporter TauE/SafE [Nocardioides albertanoniae]